MNVYELVILIIYLIAMVGIGVYFFLKGRGKGEKYYFLGGRNMKGFIAALSAGASDMSAWVLMGLPGAICISGLSSVWISIGLLIGTILAWMFVAPRLRRFAIKADDAITVPEFLSNRFKTKSPTLRIASAIVFLFGYCLYAASSIVACGNVFVAIVPTADKQLVEIISALIIVSYTFLGGFNAVCWTDFFQGILMLIALMVVPIATYITLQTSGAIAPVETSSNYYNFLSSGNLDWASVAEILTGLGWGLGYFGMPHILVRYMSVKSEKEMKKSKIIGIVWIFVILLFATIVGLVGHEYLGNTMNGDNKSNVFIIMVQKVFEYGGLAIFAGVFLSAIIAASMSTADSQLLASSSAFASDIYKTTIRKQANDKEVLWVGRIAVIIILIIALLIALFGPADIMGLVSAAWSIFGSAFGPAILLALFWKRFNYKGACTGIITGFLVSVLWMVLFNFEYYGFTSVALNTGLYEIIPGFVIGLIVAVVVSLLTKEPSEEIKALFDSVDNFTEEIEEQQENA